MRGRTLQFRQSAVACEAGGVAHGSAETTVIGMLIFHERGREHDGGLITSNMFREHQRVRRLDLELSVTVELDKFQRRSEKRRRFLSFGESFCRGAVRRGFASRANNKMNGPPGPSFAGHDGAASEFNVVGVRAEDE